MKNSSKPLFLLPILSILLTGCDFNEILDTVKDFAADKVVNPVKDLVELPTDEEDKVETNTNHIDKSTITDEYLVKNFKSEYKIVIPSTSSYSTEMGYAKDELTNIFKEATGISLPTIDGSSLSHSAENLYISLGNTNLYQTSGLNFDLSDLKRDGFKIGTEDKTIFIVGKNDTAVLYGVYYFLKTEFNFEVFTPNTYSLNKNVKNVNLRNYDVFENPDIDMRTRKGYLNPVDYSNNDNVMFAYRMKSIDKTEDFLLPIHSGDPSSTEHNEVHNSYYFVPKNEYNLANNPEFFSASGQLCFTCQGNKEKLDAMAKQASEHVIASLVHYKNRPQYNVVQFGIVDMTPMCTCESCRKCYEDHNGSKASTIIIFLYKMGRYVVDWMNEPENVEYKRDLKFMFLAYADSLRSPFKRGNDGKLIVPTELKPYNDVNVMPYCCFSDFDESLAYSADDNETIRGYVKDWAEVYSGCFAWSYGTFFNDYFAFYDAYSFYDGYYKDLTKYGYSLVYEQLHSDQRGADTGFHQCIGYCQAKLSWNSTLDMNTLIENYFKAVYGIAYETMKDIFTTFRIYFSTVLRGFASNNGANVTSNKTIWNEKNIGFINETMAKFDKAISSISIYENNTGEYSRLKYNIDLEWLYPAKIIVDCYKDYFNAAEYNAILAKFKTLIEQMQIREHKEFTNISSYLATLSEK